MKKPVADPNRWKVPSRNVWVTSKLQVTRSPWIFPLDRAAVSDIVSPPVGVNPKVTVNDWSTNTAVLPTTWPGGRDVSACRLPLTEDVSCRACCRGELRLLWPARSRRCRLAVQGDHPPRLPVRPRRNLLRYEQQGNHAIAVIDLPRFFAPSVCSRLIMDSMKRTR